jgi:integrase
MVEDMPFPKRPIRFPQVLSQEEVERLIPGAGSQLHRIWLLMLHATGMRREELVRLSIGDTDSDRRVYTKQETPATTLRGSPNGTTQRACAHAQRALMRPFFGKLWKDPMQSGPSKQGLPALHGVLPTKSEKTGALGRIKF